MKVMQFSSICAFSVLMLMQSILPIGAIAQQIWNCEILLNAQQRSVAQEAIALDVHGKPHVILSGDGIHHKWCDDSGWHEESVYSSEQTLSSPSLNISLDGTVHTIFTEGRDREMGVQY